MSVWCYIWIVGSVVVTLTALALAVRHFKRVADRQRAITALLCD